MLPRKLCLAPDFEAVVTPRAEFAHLECGDDGFVVSDPARPRDLYHPEDLSRNPLFGAQGSTVIVLEASRMGTAGPGVGNGADELEEAIMSLLINHTVSTPEVQFHPISASEWRVSDARIPTGDAGSILGFVEKTETDRFQLLQLGHGHGVTWMSFDSLSEVREHFTRHAA